MSLDEAHIHEEPTRSQGGDPTYRRDCVTLCPICHDKTTRKALAVKLVIIFEDAELKADGTIDFYEKGELVYKSFPHVLNYVGESDGHRFES